MKHDIAFFEDTHEYIVDGESVPSVTEILQPLSNRGYANVNPSVLEYARNRGSALHEVLEMYDLTGAAEGVPELYNYVKAYLEWCDIYRPSWTDIEQVVYQDELGYIGTLDRAGHLNGGRFCIVDIKTSNPTKEALVSVCCQTAAYATAYPKVVEIDRYALFLKSDGTFRFQNCTEYETAYLFDGYGLFIQMLNMHKTISDVLRRKKNGK